MFKKFLLLLLLMPLFSYSQNIFKVRDTLGDTLNLSSDGHISHNGGILLFEDVVELLNSNIIWVPVGEDIQTYVNYSDSGATIGLASGIIEALTDTIVIDKPLNIVGQGNAGFYTTPTTGSHGTLLTSSAADMVVFQINSDNVRIADLSINQTGDAATSIKVANNLQGVVFNNVDVIQEGTGAQKGFDVKGSSVVMRDLTFYVTSTDASAAGVYFWNDNTTTQDAVIDGFNVTGTVQGAATYAYAFASQNINDANTLDLNLSASVCKALPGTPFDIAVISTSTTTNNSTVEAYQCTFDGADYDGYQTGSNVLAVGGSDMVNNKLFGTITYRATMVSDALTTNYANVEDSVVTPKVIFEHSGGDKNWIEEDDLYLNFGGKNPFLFQRTLRIKDGYNLWLYGNILYLDQDNNDANDFLIFSATDTFDYTVADKTLRWTGTRLNLKNVLNLQPCSAPGSPIIGDIYYDSVGVKDTVWIYDGSAFQEFWAQP